MRQITDADGAQFFLHHLGFEARRLVGRGLQSEAKTNTLRIRLQACRVEQAYRAGYIMRILRKLILACRRPVAQRQQSVCGHCLSAPQRADERGLVDSAGDCLPHALVTQGGVGDVEVCVDDRRPLAGVRAQVGLIAEGMHHVER